MSTSQPIPYRVDDSHDAGLQSWVESANAADADFPIQNLPFGRFRPRGNAGGATLGGGWRLGVAIGNSILDLHAAGLVEHADMNRLMAAPLAERRALRKALSEGLRLGSARQADWQPALVAQADAEMGVPCTIGDYTDFYTSIHHATTVGKQFRPDNPLLPNYKWVPIGYHGRVSSIVCERHDVVSPAARADPRRRTPRRPPSARRGGSTTSWRSASSFARRNRSASRWHCRCRRHVFGLALFNDWSARDIQGWEYQPLGPFLSKNFAARCRRGS